MNNLIQNKYLKTEEVEQMLGLAPGSLYVMHCKKSINLPRYKIGRLVRYKLEDVQNWVENNREGEYNDK